MLKNRRHLPPQSRPLFVEMIRKLSINQCGSAHSRLVAQLSDSQSYSAAVPGPHRDATPISPRSWAQRSGVGGQRDHVADAEILHTLVDFHAAMRTKRLQSIDWICHESRSPAFPTGTASMSSRYG